MGAACSTACRRHLLTLAMRGGERSDGTELIVHARPTRPRPRVLASEVARARPAPPRPARVWLGGRCAHCSAPFITATNSLTCSTACGLASRENMLRAKGHRYRARKRDAYVSNVNPAHIFERDGWKCHVCGGQIDRRARRTPLAPSLDHVIPLANGGTHEPSNVWACHLGCNSLRGNTPHILTRTGERVSVLF